MTIHKQKRNHNMIALQCANLKQVGIVAVQVQHIVIQINMEWE